MSVMLLRFLALIMLLIPLAAYSVTEPKNFNLGIGYHSLELYNETDTYDGIVLRGASLSAAYMFSDNVALRGNYYSLNKNDLISTDVGGTEILACFGSGLATRGGKWYFSGGYFREQWDSATESNSFDGWQLGGGFGFNWESSSFDMLIQLRDVDDYDNHLGQSGAEIVTAGVLSLIFSARF